MDYFRLSKPIVIWGRGARGRALFRVLGRENVAAFIDMNKTQIEGSVGDCPTISFEEYLEGDYCGLPIVVSAINFERQIQRMLDAYDTLCYFLLSKEPSELQGHGNKGFIEKIPLPANNNPIVIVGSTLYACICYEWFASNGCNTIFLFVGDERRKNNIAKNFGYNVIDSIEDFACLRYYIATREPFINAIDNEKIIDLFDCSSSEVNEYNGELKKYKNIHCGEVCFIIGNGPSLKIEDVCKIKGASTFGVNRIYLLSEKWKPDYYVCTDQKILEDERVFSNNATTSFYPDIVRDKLKKGDEFIHVTHQISADNNYCIPFSNDITKTVYSGGNVIYIAMQISVYMGFSELILLGVDCNYPPNGPSHFYGDDFDAGGDPQWEIIINSYKSAKKYADDNGVKIYNATRGGKLEVFERVDFDSIISK